VRRVVGIGAVALLAAALVPGAHGASSAPVVAVKDDFFSPARLTVRRGEKVIWRWRGDSLHNVVGNGWHSPTMRRGAYSRTFRAVGTYGYVCTLHPRMRGKVVVERRPRRLR
jgi:plastocyanin